MKTTKRSFFVSGFTGALLCASALCGSNLCVPAQAAPAPETAIALPNGPVLILRPDRTAPRVAISLQVRAGAADENAENAGWRRLLTDAMLRAARPPGDANGEFLSGLQLQQRADALGGQFGAAVGDDSIAFSLSGSSIKMPELLALIRTLVENPRLSDADIDRSRRGLLAQLENESEDVAGRASTALRERLYRDASGALIAYGLPGTGTLQSLNALTPERVRELHKTYFHQSRQVIAIAGDFDPNAVRALVNRNTDNATATAGAETKPTFAVPDVKQPPLVVRQMQTPGAWVFITYTTGNAANVGAEDWPALQVLAAALGKSPQARLPKRLLDTRGRISGVVPTADTLVIDFSPRRFRGEFVLFALTETSQVEGVKNVMLSEVQRLKDTPLAATELEAAKNFARGAWATDRQSLQERAYQSALAFSLTAGLSAQPLLDSTLPARLQKVSAQDVQNAAQKYLNSYAVALVLPQAPTNFGL